MKAAEVRKMGEDELKQELAKLRNDLYDLRTQGVTEKVEDTSKYGKMRKDIARLLTEQRSRALKTSKA
jgi:large subunit ribosomal protein L29